MSELKPRAVLSTFEMTVEVAGINVKPGSTATSGSGTLAWTNPVLPADATVVGTKLTGNVKAGGDGIKTISVNGVDIPFTTEADAPFEIDLGTTLVTSVPVKLTKAIFKNHSVDYKDVVYTITYQLVAWEVSFINWDGSLISYQVIQPGDDAVAPTAYRRGYVHTSSCRLSRSCRKRASAFGMTVVLRRARNGPNILPTILKDVRLPCSLFRMMHWHPETAPAR